MDEITVDDYHFSSRYPIPFRVLFLSFATLLGFATNLHILAYLGIDTAFVLDIRSTSSGSLGTRNQSPAAYLHPSRLYPPIYHLSLLGLLWTTVGWVLFAKLTGGDPQQMVEWRSVPAFVVFVAGLALIVPWNALYRRERMMFLRSLRRTIFSGLYTAVPFCDIILADILTSSAKVLGDVWVAGCLLFSKSEAFGVDGTVDGVYGGMWMVPIMTSLPYFFRFRQCISEILTGSTPTPEKSMLNALKYASAFPVIILSAMQSVNGSPLEEADETMGDSWMNKNTLFSLWVLAVMANSLFSFWWDVTNDWGLSLLSGNGWSASNTLSYSFPTITPKFATRGRTHLSTLDVKSSVPAPPSRPPSPGRHSHSLTPNRPSHLRAYSTAAAPNVSFPFLRPILLLPDPSIYYLAIAIDLVLRFTWSLKLSSHLHSMNEIESDTFLIEALEVIRRWMWVYLRLEWEAVRKGGGGLEARDGETRLRAAEEEDSLPLRPVDPIDYKNPAYDIDYNNKDEVGLGILARSVV